MRSLMKGIILILYLSSAVSSLAELIKGTRNFARAVKKVFNPHIAMHTRVRHLRCVTPAACVTFEGNLAVLPTFAGCSVPAFDIWFLPSHLRSSSDVL